METLFFSPDGGGMPQPENAPTLLHQPLTKLQKLSCVAGITSGSLQGEATTVVSINFSNTRKSNRKRVFRCLSAAGLTIKYMSLSPLGQFMQLRLQPSKTLTL